jgi:hypothetical protein
MASEVSSSDASFATPLLDGAVLQRDEDGHARLRLLPPAGSRVLVDGGDAHVAARGQDVVEVLVPGGGWREVRILRGDAELAVARVLAGEVFVVAGQSNSANWGEERLSSTDERVRAFDGRAWNAADDPLEGVQDDSRGGSPWPVTGAVLARELDCGIGFASCGHGGSSIRAWQGAGRHERDGRRLRLQDALVERLRTLGRVRGVLWHQGEADADLGMDRDEYARLFERLRAEVAHAAGRATPWWIARATFVPGRAADVLAGVRAAQIELASRAGLHAGPDTDALLGPLRHRVDGIHFSRAGLVAHGEAWAAAILQVLRPA